METLPDIPRAFTALAEWAACMVIIFSAKRRLTGRKFAILSAGMLVLQTFFLQVTGNLVSLLWLLCMLFAVVLMNLFIRICVEGSWPDILYLGLQAFVIAEFTASLEWQIALFIQVGESDLMAQSILILLVFGGFYVLVWRALYPYRFAEHTLGITWKELLTTALIAIAVFAVSNLSFLGVDTPFSGHGVSVGAIRTITDLAGIAMLYAFHVQRQELRARREVDALQNVLQHQYQQYQQSEESINLINRKYHDMKHQITVLRMEADPEKRNAFLNQMEEEIRQYEVENKTGNKVVDTILSSKSALCAKYGIELNCVVDGALLDFMDVMDLCTILGNALDNAIESARQIRDKEKRLIRMAVFSKKNFVILRFENYFEGELTLKEGLPVTTKKKQQGYHGYGLKSIQYTAKKYGGAASFGVKDKWFELRILIPRQRKEPEES